MHNIGNRQSWDLKGMQIQGSVTVEATKSAEEGQGGVEEVVIGAEVGEGQVEVQLLEEPGVHELVVCGPGVLATGHGVVEDIGVGLADLGNVLLEAGAIRCKKEALLMTMEPNRALDGVMLRRTMGRPSAANGPRDAPATGAVVPPIEGDVVSVEPLHHQFQGRRTWKQAVRGSAKAAPSAWWWAAS
jgi:hypothetical protein